MFGGGVEPRMNDSTLPIRTTAIRGQLQFWWRATVGSRCSTLEELREAQTEIWGSTERASSSQLRIEDIRVRESTPCAKIEWDNSARHGKGGWRTIWLDPFNNYSHSLPYVLFPFQGETPLPNPNEKVKVPPSTCIRQAKFRLHIQCPNDILTQVEPAIWAWANFGGLGGRTRRGCGTIVCKELASSNVEELQTIFSHYIPEVYPSRAWPTIAENLMLTTHEEPNDPMSVWGRLAGIYKDFRQGEHFARNLGGKKNRPGRSRFPESETIRRITGQRSSQHSRLTEIPDDAFPRAEFGLPIVFHFEGNGEPPDTNLYSSDGHDGQKRDRMASPLIMKPIVLKSGKAIPLIMRLRTPDLIGVDLRLGENSLNLPSSTVIRDPRLSSYPNSPLKGSVSGSAIEAFLAFARSKGFTEVNL